MPACDLTTVQSLIAHAPVYGLYFTALTLLVSFLTTWRSTLRCERNEYREQVQTLRVEVQYLKDENYELHRRYRDDSYP